MLRKSNRLGVVQRTSNWLGAGLKKSSLPGGMQKQNNKLGVGLKKSCRLGAVLSRSSSLGGGLKKSNRCPESWHAFVAVTCCNIYIYTKQSMHKQESLQKMY